MSLACFPFSSLQEDNFAGLGRSASRDSFTSRQQHQLAPAENDASLAVRQLPVMDAASLPHVPEVLVRFCMS